MMKAANVNIHAVLLKANKRSTAVSRIIHPDISPWPCFCQSVQREKPGLMANPICTMQKHSTPIASQQRAPGRGATEQLPRHAARPVIPLLGVLDVATAKYPG